MAEEDDDRKSGESEKADAGLQRLKPPRVSPTWGARPGGESSSKLRPPGAAAPRPFLRAPGAKPSEPRTNPGLGEEELERKTSVDGSPASARVNVPAPDATASPNTRTLLYGAPKPSAAPHDRADVSPEPPESLASSELVEEVGEDYAEVIDSDSLDWDAGAVEPQGNGVLTTSDGERTDAGQKPHDVAPGPQAAAITTPDGTPQPQRVSHRPPGAYSMHVPPERTRSREMPAIASATQTMAGEEEPPSSGTPNPLDQELKTRADRLAKEDPTGAAHAHIELGLLCEWVLADRERAQKHYETARKLERVLPAALTRLRRLLGISEEAQDVLEDEVAMAETDAARAALLSTSARLYEVQNKLPKARQAFEEALKFNPRSAAALQGLEVVLRRELAQNAKTFAAPLAAHLLTWADVASPDGSDGDATLAAWFLVERAELLERKLADVGSAREALKRAVALAPNPGPVRGALVRHLARHDRDGGLAEALRVEAERESDPDRTARLCYAAARILLDRSVSRGEGVASLFRAESCASSGSQTQERVLAELLRQLEQDNDFARIVDVRVKRLPLLTKAEAIAFEYVRLADAYGRLGRADLAADSALRALTSDPTNRVVRESLDQSYARMGRHGERVRIWLLEANSERSTKERVSAFLRAADIASRHLAQPDQAIDALRGAWMISPGHPATFDQLAGLLRPRRASAEVAKLSEQRIDLYEQAVTAETDQEHKLALLEKIGAIWEDELDRPDRAITIAERMLAIEPGRRAALVALARSARRSNDTEKLLFALSEEASRTNDVPLRVRLLLEAAEVADYKNEIEKSLAFVDKALTSKPNDAECGRARVRSLRKLHRLDEARKTLLSLVVNDPESAFDTWMEIAELDEVHRKAPLDAVEAYRSAQKLRADHPLPTLSLIRLLRQTKNHKRLVVELKALSREEQEPRARAQLHMMAAEVEEHCLGDDEASLRSLAVADDALQELGDGTWDPTVFESTERILFRMGDDAGLMRLYARWLERKPAAAIDHSLRVGLAAALEDASPAQAGEVLDALVSVVPKHVPALRRLVHLRRGLGEHPALSQNLFAQASVIGSRTARTGALWEVVTMEERVGAAHTLEALTRIIREDPNDTGALDAMVRVASRLVNNVGVPHPALLAARGHLLHAVRTRRELTVDPLGKAAYHLEEATLLEHAEVDRDPARALDGYREALALWPTCTLAARGLERLGTELGDHRAIIQSQMALSKLTPIASEKAAYMVRAADLLSSQIRDDRGALELYEFAQETDPENRDAARALASMLTNDPRRLTDRFRAVFDRVSTSTQVAFMGVEIAQAYLRIHRNEGDNARIDYGPGIAAMRRAISTRSEDISSLFILSGLYSAQKAWGESRDTLQRIVEISQPAEKKERLAAQFALVDLFEGSLSDPPLAEATLLGILKQDSTNKTALERLHALAVRTGDKALARSSLERLAEYETDLAQRTEYQLRVAEVCREANDGAGMLRALSDAVVSTPSDLRPWTLISRLYRAETQEGALGLAHAIEQILEMAKGRRRPQEARWLYTLGLLELNMLKRINEGLTHLQTAIGAASVAAPAHGQVSPVAELRAALGLGLLAAGRTKDAVMVLRELVTTDGDTLIRLLEPSAFNTVRIACVAATGSILSSVLSCLDAALATEGRSDEKIPVEELRSILGDVSAERATKLRARRLEVDAPFPNGLGPKELSAFLFPEARNPFIEVAVAIQPIVPKVLGFTTSSFGVASRDRVNARDGHPTRILLDRLARTFGITEYELYLSPTWTGPARVIAGDPPAIVAPASMVELPETEQAFCFARLLTRITLGLTFIDDVPPETVDGLLTSAMRTVFPNWGLGELNPQREHALGLSLPAMQRAIGRVQRKLLQERAQGIPGVLNPQAFVSAVRRTEYRVAYVLSGDLLGGIDVMRRSEPELGRSGENARSYLAYPMCNEFIRFALTLEAYTERRKLGVIWANG